MALAPQHGAKTHLRVPERAGVVKRDQTAVVTSVDVGARPQEVVHDVLTAKTCRSGQRSEVNIPTEGEYFYIVMNNQYYRTERPLSLLLLLSYKIVQQRPYVEYSKVRISVVIICKSLLLHVNVNPPKLVIIVFRLRELKTEELLREATCWLPW